VYLKDQWLQFQIKTLAQTSTIPFQDYGQFMHLCDHSSAEDKAKLAEFYLYNMALIDMNLWDPNAAFKDLQMMAMASWMSHEKKRAVEVQKIMPKELNEPLMIRAKLVDPMALIYAHNTLQLILKLSLTMLTSKPRLLLISRTWRDCLEMTAFMLA